MKKNILVVGPCLSQSGYGYQTVFALKALRSREDLFNIYVQPTSWGKTGWVWEDNEFRSWLDSRITESQILIQKNQLPVDMTLQVTIPNEWRKISEINIGYTAGIETSKVAPVWLQKGNEAVSKILVVSEHAKQTYKNTSVTVTNSKTGETFPYSLKTPIEVVHELTERAEPEPLEKLQLEYDFNFLCLSQWSPRKNFTNTIQWWVEEFIDQEVGLVVKTNLMCNSLKDRHFTEVKIKQLLEKYPDRKCKVYLLHGDLTSGQMTGLYNNDKIKALINLSHGEGFGLPLFEAAREALPVITVPWSGHMDFLSHGGNNYFEAVEYKLKPVQPEAAWEGVIERDSMWAYADQGSYKMALRKVYKNWESTKQTAIALQEINKVRFDEQLKYKGFIDAILGFDSSLLMPDDGDEELLEFE